MVIKHTIVYAENDFDDYYLLKTALEEVRPDIDLVHVDNGWEMLQYLQNLKLPSLYPSLVILDINMEGIGGKDTLRIMKSTKRFSDIPTIMFTSSASELDRVFCRENKIDILTKPSGYSELLEQARFFGKQSDEFATEAKVEA